MFLWHLPQPQIHLGRLAESELLQLVWFIDCFIGLPGASIHRILWQSPMRAD